MAYLDKDGSSWQLVCTFAGMLPSTQVDLLRDSLKAEEKQAHRCRVASWWPTGGLRGHGELCHYTVLIVVLGGRRLI